MKNFGKIAVWLAGGLALNVGLYVCGGAAPGNPYEPIVTRNVFNLNPPKPVDNHKQVEPPSKITPDGIMTIFGSRQVLFKVAIPPHPPKPATEKHYILSEGEGQDGIEVKHIDEKKGMITFDNHGVVQRIPLVKAGPITTPTPVVMRSGHKPPPPGAPNARQIPPSIANRLNQARNNRTYRQRFGNDNGSYDNGSSGSANSSYGSTSAQSQKKLTPEEQMIMIAAQHAEYQKQGNPIANIFPRTPLDEAAGVVSKNGSSSSSSSSSPPTP